jgi:hypothetical protein
MRLNLLDFYKREFKASVIVFALVGVLIAILKFLHWSTVETVMGAAGSVWDWILITLVGLVTIAATLVGIVLLISPYQRYKEYSSSKRYAARVTHWEGALAKSMRDFGRALKEGNEIGIEKTAIILLKEIQVQCTFGTPIREIQTKLEGVCEGILVGSPKQFAEHIELQLVVRPEDLYEYLQLNVGGRKYKRSLQCAA